MTRRWRLFPKYALLIITLVGSMLIVSGAIGIYFSWRENEAHLEALQLEKAQNAAYRIEQYIVDIEHELSWTALPRADADADALESRRIEYLKLQRQAPAITEVVWIDPNGREQLRISRLAMDAVGSGTDLSGDPKFRRVASGAVPVYYGPVYFRKGTEPYMTIARPAGSGGGGVTAAEVNLKFVWDVVSQIKIGTGTAGLAYVVDANGVLIAHPDISLVLKNSDLSTLPQVAALLRPVSGRAPVARNLKGEEVFAANASIPRLRWTVFVETPRTEAFAPLYATLQRTSLLLVAALLISIAASFFLARALVRPLRALQEGAAQIGAGDLERHIEVRTGDELEGLAEQFNRMSAQLRESYAGLERKVEQRTAELSEALEQQTATSEVLKLISRSTFDLDAVLRTLLESACRLCGAKGGVLYRPDAAGNYLPVVVLGAGDAEERHRALLRSKPIRPDEGSAAGRAVLHRKTVHIDDVRLDPLYQRQDLVENSPYRNVLAVPLLRAGEPIGVIALSNTLEGSSFTPGQIELVTTFADQAVIAIENARLFNETKEALEQQTATAEVLRVISGSVADSKPVFEKILESCQRLFASNEQGILLVGDDNLLHLGAHHGAARERLEKLFPIPRAVGADAASRERSVLHLRDVLHDADVPPGLRVIAEQIGVGTYSQVIAPMLWEGESIGSLYVIRQPAVGFSEKEIGLLRTFADQAVIAIQNARLFNETREALRKVEMRTAELSEALDYQTAISDVLRVISQSPTDVTPVFEAILESASRLFGSPLSAVFRYDGRLVHLAATRNWPDAAILDASRFYPAPPNPQMLSGRVILSGTVQSEEDALTDPHYDRQAAGLGHWRRMIGAPLLRDGQPIGAIIVAWQDPGVTPTRQADLLETFADQAVIAIENVRLLSETTEALEQQTATAEVLQAIGASVSDATPVLDKILQACEILLGGRDMAVSVADEFSIMEVRAVRGSKAARLRDAMPPARIDESATLLAVRERRVLAFAQVLADPHAPEYLRRVVEHLGDDHAVALAPILWKGSCVGSILILRACGTAFDDKELKLLSTLASQAAIAIENARLFNESKESLSHQGVAGDVLRVIGTSLTDAQPVFDAVTGKSAPLFTDAYLWIALRFGESVRDVSTSNAILAQSAEWDAVLRTPLSREHINAAAILDREAVDVIDITGRTGGRASMQVSAPLKAGWEHFARTGYRAITVVPILRGDEAVGAIGVARRRPVPLGEKHFALLWTLADQVAIALDNVRLFNETREALEQQTATAEVLQVISGSVADTAPVFDKILDSCERLFAASGLGIYLVDEEGMLRKAGFRSAREKPERALAGTFPLRLEGTATEVAIRERRVVHYGDVLAAPDAPAPLVRIAQTAGSFSIAFAPMLWEGRGVGAIQVSRDPPQPFSEKELALLKTFADQAVIAIQNARLFNEIQAKSRELEMANKHKSEFLANMSHELRTPLNAIIGFSEVLSEKMFGEVNDKQLEYLLDIHTSGHHLLTLINDILDLSKIEAGRMDLDLATTNLPMLLDNCMTLVRERASRQGLVLALDVEEGLGDWVADIRKLKQVVINLLSNAVKFTPAGGKVTLRARRLENAVEIAVVDTGVGIAADQQALVFEEFRQAGGDYLRKSEGTGLGLSLAKRFVELHGGTMRVESAPGQGSTFAFVLPERVVEAV